MDLAQMLMFQQLGNSPPVQQKAQAPVPFADQQENPIVKMMRGPAAEDDGGALQLQKLQMSGSVPQPKDADQAYQNYVEANSRGLTQQREALAELAKLVGENKPDVNPMQNLFTGLQDTVTGGSKLEKLMAVQQAGKDAFLKQNQALQKAREGYTDKENDLEKTKLTYAQAQDKAKADREQFKLLYGLKANKENNKPEADLKDAQVQSATYGKRISQAEGVFKDLEKSGYNRADFGEGTKDFLSKIPGMGNFTPENLKRQKQAEQNFVTATLRKESGAAISESEFTVAEQQYFPRPGDTPEVLAQKRANRAQVLEGMKLGAGRAWDKLPQVEGEIGTGSKNISEDAGFQAWKKANGHE